MKKFLQKVALGILSLSLCLGFASFATNNLQVSAQSAKDISIGKTLTDSGGDTVVTDPNKLIKNVVNIIFIVAAAIVFAYLIWGAISWITSGGDKSKVEVARNRITSAVIGLLILVAVWALFNLVITIAFGGDVEIKSLNSNN